MSDPETNQLLKSLLKECNPLSKDSLTRFFHHFQVIALMNEITNYGKNALNMLYIQKDAIHRCSFIPCFLQSSLIDLLV